MRSHLLASLTSKVAVGVAATVITAGSAGAVLATQTISDNTPVHAQDEVTTTTSTTSTTSTTIAPTTTTTSTTVAPTTTTTAKPADDHENFGATVSEDAHDGGVDGQQVSDEAHAKNDARKATQADDGTKDDDKDDATEVEHHGASGADHGNDAGHTQD